jgi:hypothetical protein
MYVYMRVGVQRQVLLMTERERERSPSSPRYLMQAKRSQNLTQQDNWRILESV